MATVPRHSRAELQRQAKPLAEQLVRETLSGLQQKFDRRKCKMSIDITMSGSISKAIFDFSGPDIDVADEFARLVLNAAARHFKLLLGCADVSIVRSRQSNLDRAVVPGQSTLYTVKLES